MDTGVIITLIICGTIFAIIVVVLIAAIIFQKKSQKTISDAAQHLGRSLNEIYEEE